MRQVESDLYDWKDVMHSTLTKMFKKAKCKLKLSKWSQEARMDWYAKFADDHTYQKEDAEAEE